MKRLVLPALLGLAAGGCVRAPSALASPVAETGKCELVHTLMREPLPLRYLAGMAQGRSTPVPVLVFVRRPEEGLLERFFVGEPSCEDASFRVVQQGLEESVVLFLQPVADGYTFDVQRADPEGLSLGGMPKGAVRREGGGWVVTGQ